MTSYKPYWNTRTYTEEEFKEAWNSSVSVAECARRLNLTIYGTTYKTLKSTAIYLELTSEHMTGRSTNRGSTHKGGKTALPIETYLVEGRSTSNSGLKSRLIKEGLLDERCSLEFCANPEVTVNGFTGSVEKTPLTLDHINGINTDNRIENLRLICAVCDRFNPTFCRKNTKPRSKTNHDKSPDLSCECGSRKMKKSVVCRKCRDKNLYGFVSRQRATKIIWPSDKDLVIMIADSNFLQLGKTLGVSDNAVRKHMKRRGLLG